MARKLTAVTGLRRVMVKIARLVKEKPAQPPDLPLNKVEAHEVIDTLKAGTYDYSKWHVAFRPRKRRC